jgi:hypothetical protein
MRSIIPSKLEEGRVREGRMASTSDYGTTGAFFVTGPKGVVLKIVSSDGEGWEHVSVSTEHRTPNWAEMCFVKDLFWSEDECVVQFHPPKSQYINCHPYCLHLWKPRGITLPQPPSILVGPRAGVEK